MIEGEIKITETGIEIFINGAFTRIEPITDGDKIKLLKRENEYLWKQLRRHKQYRPAFFDID